MILSVLDTCRGKRTRFGGFWIGLRSVVKPGQCSLQVSGSQDHEMVPALSSGEVD
jgi:hypothetical protein